ncbi:hypothetical protein RSAG8_05644, partial [Rhizoctonia solani AG-8 WAC10335]
MLLASVVACLLQSASQLIHDDPLYTSSPNCNHVNAFLQAIADTSQGSGILEGSIPADPAIY